MYCCRHIVAIGEEESNGWDLKIDVPEIRITSNFNFFLFLFYFIFKIIRIIIRSNELDLLGIISLQLLLLYE